MTFGGADAQASLEVMRPAPVHNDRYGYGNDYRYGRLARSPLRPLAARGAPDPAPPRLPQHQLSRPQRLGLSGARHRLPRPPRRAGRERTQRRDPLRLSYLNPTFPPPCDACGGENRALPTPPPAPDEAGGPLDRRPFPFKSPSRDLLAERGHSISGDELPAAAGRPQSLQVPLGPSHRIPEQSRPEGRGRSNTVTDDEASSFAMRAFRPTARRCGALSSSCRGAPSSSKSISRRSTISAAAVSRSRHSTARGQGGSSRLLGNPRKGHVRDFADHVNDFETGHAGGGPAGLSAALLRARAFDRRGRRAPLRAAPAHADRPHGADRAAAGAARTARRSTAGAHHRLPHAFRAWRGLLRPAPARP